VEFGLSEEQRLLTDNVNRFLAEQAPLDKVRAFADSGKDEGIWTGLIELGVGALLIPEAQGGIGLGPLDAALVAECLGYHTTPVPFLGSAVLAPSALILGGSLGSSFGGSLDEATASELFGQLASGTLTVGVALSEATGARRQAGIQANTPGKGSSKGSTLTGQALHVVDYGAGAYLVADTDSRLYLVAADAAGLTGQGLTTIDKTRPTGELKLDNTPAQCLSEDPEILRQILDIARVMLAADTLGASQNMIDQAVAYAKQREQFNRVIASFQAVKHMCAEMAAKLEPCRSMVWYAAHALQNVPTEARLTACHTKAHLSEVGKFVAKISTEVHGGMGFTDLVGLHYWFKRIGYNRQTLGSPERLRVEAAQLQELA
jgi:alkylation response protein AidB-like acyl-CoA dehydrogenase